MRDNTCPNCGSHEIYVSQNGGGIGDGFGIGVLIGDMLKPTRKWETHLCASCGHWENLLLDTEMIQKIVADPKSNGWKKAAS